MSIIDTSLCAQVTGMLLDLDILSICHLLYDFKALERAVFKAKEEYLKFKKVCFIGRAYSILLLASCFFWLAYCLDAIK